MSTAYPRPFSVNSTEPYGACTINPCAASLRTASETDDIRSPVCFEIRVAVTGSADHSVRLQMTFK